MSDQIAELATYAAVEKTLLRALARELIRFISEQSPNPSSARRDMAARLHEYADKFEIAGADEAMLEDIKERARADIDYMFSPDFWGRPPGDPA